MVWEVGVWVWTGIGEEDGEAPLDWITTGGVPAEGADGFITILVTVLPCCIGGCWTSFDGWLTVAGMKDNLGSGTNLEGELSANL